MLEEKNRVQQEGISLLGNKRNASDKGAFKKLKMLIIRTNNRGELKFSKPCCNCIEKLKKFGVKSVYYSTDEGTIIKERLDTICGDHKSGGQKMLLRIKKLKN